MSPNACAVVVFVETAVAACMILYGESRKIKILQPDTESSIIRIIRSSDILSYSCRKAVVCDSSDLYASHVHKTYI